MIPLVQQHCLAQEGQPAMNAQQVARHLADAPGWTLIDGSIEKQFRFEDFHRTMAFVNALAWVAHVEDHHPDLAVSYGRCTLRFNTHSVGGISINDFICAAKVDALLP
ncbi:MAG: 4a-hydroxytetrahydrobiopterin dehydratase [Chitinophagaceae bacterium]|nr:4a-hydroxytetrahydrobiopterin dehydratase [Rubrivivax sp.]